MVVWGPSYGDDASYKDEAWGPLMFSAYHVVTNEDDLWYEFDSRPTHTNFWLAHDHRTGVDARLYMTFFCSTTIRGCKLKNTQMLKVMAEGPKISKSSPQYQAVDHGQKF